MISEKMEKFLQSGQLSVEHLCTPEEMAAILAFNIRAHGLLRALLEEREMVQEAQREGWALPLVERADRQFKAVNALIAKIEGEK